MEASQLYVQGACHAGTLKVSVSFTVTVQILLTVFVNNVTQAVVNDVELVAPHVQLIVLPVVQVLTVFTLPIVIVHAVPVKSVDGSVIFSTAAWFNVHVPVRTFLTTVAVCEDVDALAVQLHSQVNVHDDDHAGLNTNFKGAVVQASVLFNVIKDNTNNQNTAIAVIPNLNHFFIFLFYL